MELISWRGLHIYPLPAEFAIEVTQADINNGIPGSCTDCAISLAACRALGIPELGFLATSSRGIVLFLRSQSSRAGITLGERAIAWSCAEAGPPHALIPMGAYNLFIDDFDNEQAANPQPSSFHFYLEQGSLINFKETQL